MSEEPDNKIGLAIGGALLLGLTAYAFSGGKGPNGGYLDAWKKEQEADPVTEPASEEIATDDSPEADDDPSPSGDEPESTEEPSHV
jgi:hypothetical protein